MKKIGGLGLVLCLVVALLGCGKATKVSEADKAKNAENLLETVFSMDEDMAEGFQEISGQEDLDAWADQYFGSYMTDDGLKSAMQSRFLSEGVTLELTGVTVEKPEVTVEKRENAGDSEWYDYTVALQTSDGQKEYRGSLLLTEKDGQWLVDDVAKQ